MDNDANAAWATVKVRPLDAIFFPTSATTTAPTSAVIADTLNHAPITLREMMSMSAMRNAARKNNHSASTLRARLRAAITDGPDSSVEGLGQHHSGVSVVGHVDAELFDQSGDCLVDRING